MRHQPAATRPWERFLILTALLLAPAFGRADIITQVSCSIPGQTQTAVTSCAGQGSNHDLAQESITTSIVYPASASDSFLFNLKASGIASADIGSDTDATSSAHVDMSLKTAGPERAGYIEIVPSLIRDTIYARDSLSFSIGPLQSSCTMYGMSECLVQGEAVNWPSFPRIYAFTLGDPFSFDVNYSDMLDAWEEDSFAHTNVNFDLQFRFFEQDGVTPVALNPEPSSWALAFTGLTAALAFALRRQRSARKG